MNSTAHVVPRSSFLPSSGTLVQCRQEPDVPPDFTISYVSYQHLLDVLESLFTAAELKLMIWVHHDCEHDDCEYCEAYIWYMENHLEPTMQARVWTPGWIKFNQLDTFDTDDWFIRDIYAAVHFHVRGHYPTVTDEEAFDILWNGEEFVEQFGTYHSKV